MSEQLNNENIVKIEPINNYVDQFYNDMNYEVDKRLDQVWEYILYREFRDKKIQELIKEKKKLIKDYEDLHLKKMEIEDELEFSRKKVRKMSMKLEQNTNKKKRKANVDLDSFVKKNLKKPKMYKKIENVNDVFINILKNLESIEDIINLEDHPNRSQLKKYDKFKNLYRLIPVLKEVNNLIGMDKSKKQLFRHLAYFLHGVSTGNEIMHIQITGPPGVGKTTLANILSRVYLVLGFLSNDNVVVD